MMKWIDHPTKATDPKPPDGSPGSSTPGAWSSEPRESSGLLPVDPTPQHFRTVRRILIAEAAVLAVIGIWGAVALILTRNPVATSVTVIVFQITPGYAIVLASTAVLALLSTLKYRTAFWFSLVQFFVYLFLFVSTAGTDTWPAIGEGNVILNAALGIGGLGLVLWISPLSLGGMHWVHPSALRQPDRTRRSGWR